MCSSCRVSDFLELVTRKYLCLCHFQRIFTKSSSQTFVQSNHYKHPALFMRLLMSPIVQEWVHFKKASVRCLCIVEQLNCWYFNLGNGIWKRRIMTEHEQHRLLFNLLEPTADDREQHMWSQSTRPACSACFSLLFCALLCFSLLFSALLCFSTYSALLLALLSSA